MSSRHLMAGEWIGQDGKLHGPYVCECHGVHPPYSASVGGARYLESARRMVGLIDDLGYALCARCKSRLENEEKLYCPSCEEIIFHEKKAGVFK